MKINSMNNLDIIFKERYGSSSTSEFYYVQPPGENRIILISPHKFSNIATFITKIFLPQGYPESVSKDYVAYQIWDTAQAFCSTITGILATQEVLRGVGVGDSAATPLAATITWVIKDGCGHMARILFAFSHGTHLDAYSKKWRLYADTLNDAAMCIEIALPLFKNYTTFALCISTIMKAIVGVAGGATRIAMTQHHAIRGNMADVSAKDSAQETAVNLIASITAILILSIFGNSLAIFLSMIVLHIIFNYFAVRAVCLKTLNEARFLQVIDMYLRQEVIATPCEMNRKEPIIFYQLGHNLLDLKMSGFHIKLGNSMKHSIKYNYNAKYYKKLRELYCERAYILLPNIKKRETHVFFKVGVTTDKILCAYFHAVLLSIVTYAINNCSLPSFTNVDNPRPFAQICQTLKSAEWCRVSYEDRNKPNNFVYEPSCELIKYIDDTVQKEWPRIRCGLLATGWDLQKHLLIVDEWRVICKENVDGEHNIINNYLPSQR
ncbi:hypothetical protein ACJJTC_000638 [Scirpophaga incertulas]